MNPIDEFEKRKADHIRYALAPENEPTAGNGLERITLTHEALPDISFDQVSLSQTTLAQDLAGPLFVSSMTAGHQDGRQLNLRLAEASAEKNWLMGVGSQRRQLFDQEARQEWQEIRQQVPKAKLLGNIGIAQAILSKSSEIAELVDSLQAVGMIIHTNPLQEVMQPEGTTDFAGGVDAIQRLSEDLSVPVIVKETGCGFSSKTLKRLNGLGIAAVDVAGFGGTHWGRVEGARSNPEHLLARCAKTFENWGISTLDTMLATQNLSTDYSIWASGGVRSGLDAAKLVALGAEMVGIAKPLMAAALNSTQAIVDEMNRYEREMKIALFCTGHLNCQNLRQSQDWQLTSANQLGQEGPRS